MKKLLTLIATCIGIFLCLLDTSVMNIALPAIQIGLHTNLSDLSWTINAYLITFVALTLLLTRVAERFGLHKFFVAGLFLFLLGSAVSAMAPALPILVIGRIVQSLGAAVIYPLAMIIGISMVTVEKRTLAIAALGMMQGLAVAVGPSLGGVLTQVLSWRWIFLVNIPLIVLALVLSFIGLDFNEERKSVKIDGLGSLLSIVALFTLTLALVQGREWGWASLPVLSLFVVSLLTLVVFVIYEQQIDSPMIPMALFRDRQFNGAALAILLSNLFLVAVTVVLPTYFTKIQGKSETAAALLITPIYVMLFIFSPIAALLIKKIGTRLVIFLGFIAMAIAYLLFTMISMTNITEVTIACLLLGFGTGIIFGPIMVLAASDFTGEMLTGSQSVAGVLRQVGAVLAVAIFVTGLYSNINTAKSNSISYAGQEITALKLPTTTEKKLIQEVSDQIQSEKQPATTDAHVAKIVNYSKNQFSLAFIQLYRLAIPFVFLSALSAFLFKKKKPRA